MRKGLTGEPGESTVFETEETGRKYSSYRIESLVGSDGFGKLYRAYDEFLDRPAALKVLFSGLSEHKELVQHFRKNTQDLAQLTHPRIPQIYFFGKENGKFFVALEWCAGGSLSNELRRSGKLPLQQALKILHQCIEGLSAAWKLGIAHGNLKPNNVMVDENYDIKITDFGLIPVKRSDQEVQSIAGALSFMAPELADSRATDFRADIYSLGIIFHYMLLNTLPDTTSGTDPSRSSLPPEVQRVIEKMTREDPNERHSSYADLIQEIDHLTAAFPDEPVPEIPRASSLESFPIRTGDSLFDMLADLYREMETGVLKVNWLKVHKQFLIQRGEVVFFESNQPMESLANLVLSKNWLQQSEIPQDSPDPEVLMRRVLQIRACTQEQFRIAFMKLMKAGLLQVFQWPAFHGEFFRGNIDKEPFVSLRLSDVLIEASRTMIDGNWVKARISPDSLIQRTPSFERLLAPFPLNPEESFLAYRCEGEDMKPETVGILTGLPEDTVLRTLYLLQRIGALEFRPAARTRTPRPTRRIAAPPPVRPVEAIRPAPPPPPPPAPRPSPPAPEPVAMKNEPSEKPAPKKLSFQEALIPADGSPTPKPAAQTSTFVSPLSIKKAADYFASAEKEYETGNFGKAAHLCREALIHHQNAEYYHLLGASYARHPRFQRDAEDAFHKAISMAPEDADFHAVLALFYSQRDLWLRARTHCVKALEIKSGHKMANTVYKKLLEKNPGKGDCWCVRDLTSDSGT